jgi:hypothetical protein
VIDLIGRRLRFLYESANVPFDPSEPTYPLPGEFVQKLVGLSARDVLSEVHRYHEDCVTKGKMPEGPFGHENESVTSATTGTKSTVDSKREREQRIITIEQAWNEHRSMSEQVVPTDEAELAEVLAEAIVSCSSELTTGDHFEAEADGRFVEIKRHQAGSAIERIQAGICNKGPQAGALGKQIDEVAKRAGKHTPVIVRSTAFPVNPKAVVSQQLGKLIAGGGRRVVVEDSDWRTMMALAPFRSQWKADPSLAGWLKQTRPLTSLKSLRSILGLDLGPPTELKPNESAGVASPEAKPGPEPIPSPIPAPTTDPKPVVTGPLVVGTTTGLRNEPVTVEPGELTRHAAFLGAPGSGKTTAALSVVEQLLVRGVPAILVDRKGDLCAYARPDLGLRSGLNGELAERAERLRASVQVALYTPRKPDGRPLSIAAVPAGLGALPSLERDQAAKVAGAALAGMMNYADKKRDQACLAILVRAIDLLSQDNPQTALPITALVDFIAQKDPALIDAVGYLDVKLFDHLVQDLETLRLNQGDLLAAQGEPLDIDALLGRGTPAAPGQTRTRLSIISTKFLGSNQDVQFWVAQFLMTLGRWISKSPAPDGSLQAVVLFDEADLYLPAVRQPATKEPMEHLLKRARSAGLGLLLATQSPGDFDYKCRDNIRSWFVGQVKEANSIAKMKPMLNECRIDVAAQLPAQETGQFYLIRGRDVTSMKTLPSAVDPRQVPEEEIVLLSH